MKQQKSTPNYPQGTAPDSMCNDHVISPRRQCEGKEAESINHCPPRDEWGHKLVKKKEKTIRISFVNINGIGVRAKSEKSEDIRRFMVEKKVDVMGLAETNVNWGCVEGKDTLWDRTKQWAETRRIGVAYNTNQLLNRKHQQGGTATIATNDIAHRYKKCGADPSGLGRWSWILITGTQTHATRFVTIYAPQKSGTGQNTVYAQQLSHWNENPIPIFWRDLAQAITKWQSEGNQLVLMGDWNEDVVGAPLTTWMTVFHLREAITSYHGQSPPPTHQRGSHAIDGIFISDSIQVQKAGYLGFGEIPGDHRGIWIDVHQRHVLGYKMSDIPRAEARRLKLEDPRVVHKYQTILFEYLSAYKVFSRLRKLTSQIVEGVPFTEKQEHEYEEVDKIRVKGMDLAERKCRKLKMGAKLWSPALQKERDTILFWTLVLKRLKKCKIGARRLLRLKKKLNITEDTRLPREVVEIKLDDAYKRYKVCCKNDAALRRNYLEDLARAKAKVGNGKGWKMLREMQLREMSRLTFKRIRYTTKPQRCGTTKIHVKRRNGIREVTKKKDMEAYIIKENEKKFHQTEGRCPLLHGKLYRDLGSMGDGPRVKDVLNGTYNPPPGTSPAVTSWLKTMKIDNTAEREQRTTSITEFQEGWKAMNEKTATGKLHMGHFKAGAAHPKLSWIHFEMSLMPMKTGYSPKRWQSGIDVMLLKNPDVYLLNKLRTIVLYEADFNNENKRLGRSAMKNALKMGKIAKEQFSRPGRSSQDNALSKRLLFDYYRTIKRPFGICSCDLKSCYDRVVHTAASLALQRVGIPITEIRCMFGTIQSLIHKIRTSYGLSEASYGGLSKKFRKPPQGMGQGNGSGPSVWAILSSTIFEELHTKGYSTRFCMALSKGLFKMCGFAYVDDSDLIADGNNEEEVHKKLQQTLTQWDNSMEVTGGAIAPEKFWWYLIDFEWSGGKWKYKKGTTGKTLRVRDKDNKIHEIAQLPASKSKEMVGVYLAPDGNQKDQVATLQNKAETWAKRMRASCLNTEEIWIALHTTITKGLEYPLVATTIPHDKMRKIMAPVLAVALPLSGFTRKFPHAVLYGPVDYQGLGVTSLYDYQYCRHVQDIVDQNWRKTIAGNLIQANMEAVKVEAGIYGPLFDNPIEVTWFNTTNSWIIETYKYCCSNRIIFSEPGPSISPQCERDRALMEIFQTVGFSRKELMQLNRCRLYYQITSISDVTDGTGTLLSLRWVTRLPPTHTSTCLWPTQVNPSRPDWEFWDAVLKNTLCGDGLALKVPLGRWLCTSPQLTNWDHILTTSGVLYQKVNSGWIKYQADGRGSRRGQHFSIDSGQHVRNIPETEEIHRTMAWKYRRTLYTSGKRSHQEPTYPKSPTTWLSAIRSSPHASWICQWIAMPKCPIACAMYLYQGKAAGISDGSFNPEDDLSTAAWIIDFGKEGVIQGGGVVPSPDKTSSAYRGELGGLLGQLLVIAALEKVIPPTSQYQITISCDGKGALFKALRMHRSACNTRLKSFDILSAIIVLREQIHGNLIPVHVHGHQDKRGKKLTKLETRNIQMDKLAKDIARAVLEQDADIPDALPATEEGLVQVDYDETPIISKLSKTLQYHVGKERILEWWKHKKRFKANVEQKDIDWDVLERTSKQMSFAMGRFTSKWCSHHISVGRMMELREARDNNECPRCGCSTETTLHVLRCPARSSRRHWNQRLRLLEKWMRKSRTAPEIQEAIYTVLKNFPQLGEGSRVSTDTPAIRKCVVAQRKIGWTGFLEGFLSPYWATIQERHFRLLGFRRSGLKWAIGLSTQLWLFVFSMWDHRNSILFQQGKVDELSGIQKVKKAIIRERALGRGSLDSSFESFLSLPQSSFNQMKPIDLRRWLALIRNAREQAGHDYADEFSTSKALRSWIGLPDSPPDPIEPPSRKRKRSRTMRFIRTGYHE